MNGHKFKLRHQGNMLHRHVCTCGWKGRWKLRFSDAMSDWYYHKHAASLNQEYKETKVKHDKTT